MSDLLTFNVANTSKTSTTILCYSNMNLMRHSCLLRSHILHRGRTTFSLSDLRNHKYTVHDSEAFLQVIHWLAENCRADKFVWKKKQLQFDHREGVLIWRGWRMSEADGKPGFERRVPWAPLECRLPIGDEHAMPFDKALWILCYLMQLKIDPILMPEVLRFRAALENWLLENTPNVGELELMWGLFGKFKRDVKLFETGLNRFVGTMNAAQEAGGESRSGSEFLCFLPIAYGKKFHERQDSGVAMKNKSPQNGSDDRDDDVMLEKEKAT